MTFPSEKLTAAYQTSQFRVLSPHPFTLHIGKKSQDLWTAYRQHGVASAGFLTAWNPYSQETAEAQNAANQEALVQRIEALGFSWWNGLGIDPSGDRLNAPSILVLGIKHDESVSIGVAFRQNAIVWAGADAIPRLVLLR